MAKFRIDKISELSRQMQFTPQDTRAAQVTNAEELLHDLDPAKAYPLDFVIFRITGYHPKNVQEDLLTGLALQHDLGALIEQVSDTLEVHAEALAEPVLTIGDVTEKFNVTSKTIQRWRRKGLPARRFVFPDGKRRVGFLLSSVERFLQGHQDQVTRGANFSQVTDVERVEILRRARRLASLCQCCVKEITRRIAKHMNRSPLTVLHTIRKHDQLHPDAAVFRAAVEEIGDDDRSRILKGHRRGLSIRALAQRMCRPRSAVYRVIVDERLDRLNKRKVKFIDDPLYHQPDAALTIEILSANHELPDPSRTEDSRVPRDLPPYLQALYRTPLLSAAGERAMFLKFNFHKFNFVTARRRLEPQFARSRDLNLLEGHLRRSIEVKNDIVRANLRLVVSIARKHLRPGLSLMELISDGNLTLMRAVESFDIHKGYRFSTYATLALMKGFARSVPTMLASRKSGIDDRMLAELPDRRPVLATDRLIDRDHVRTLLSHLSDRERAVLLAHYGLNEAASPSTFEQVGRELGLSKERVKQIEQSALAKLRASVARAS